MHRVDSKSKSFEAAELICGGVVYLFASGGLMLQLSLKRKQILNRDLSVFGLYADYIIDGFGGTFEKKELSPRKKVAIFRWFLETLISRIESGEKISRQGGYVFLPVVHENLSAPGVAALVRQLAKILRRQKVFLVLEISSNFVTCRSNLIGLTQKQVSGAIYSMLDDGVLFSLRLMANVDDFTYRWIIGGVFSFVAINYVLVDKILDPCAQRAEQERSSALLRDLVEGGLARCVVDEVNQKEDFSKALSLPSFFFSGDYLAPEHLKSLA